MLLSSTSEVTSPVFSLIRCIIIKVKRNFIGSSLIKLTFYYILYIVPRVTSKFLVIYSFSLNILSKFIKTLKRRYNSVLNLCTFSVQCQDIYLYQDI